MKQPNFQIVKVDPETGKKRVVKKFYWPPNSDWFFQSHVRPHLIVGCSVEEIKDER